MGKFDLDCRPVHQVSSYHFSTVQAHQRHLRRGVSGPLPTQLPSFGRDEFQKRHLGSEASDLVDVKILTIADDIGPVNSTV